MKILDWVILALLVFALIFIGYGYHKFQKLSGAFSSVQDSLQVKVDAYNSLRTDYLGTIEKYVITKHWLKIYYRDGTVISEKLYPESETTITIHEPGVKPPDKPVRPTRPLRPVRPQRPAVVTKPDSTGPTVTTKVKNWGLCFTPQFEGGFMTNAEPYVGGRIKFFHAKSFGAGLGANSSGVDADISYQLPYFENLEITAGVERTLFEASPQWELKAGLAASLR